MFLINQVVEHSYFDKTQKYVSKYSTVKKRPQKRVSSHLVKEARRRHQIFSVTVAFWQCIWLNVWYPKNDKVSLQAVI